MNHSQTVHASFNSVPSPFGGLIVRPGDDGWDKARQAWNLAVDQQPAAVALPRSADDVISVVTGPAPRACASRRKVPGMQPPASPRSKTRCSPGPAASTMCRSTLSSCAPG